MSDEQLPGSGDRGGSPERADVSGDVFLPGCVAAMDARQGILTVQGDAFDLSPAQRINLLWLTARGYEPLWRHRSIAVLTGGDFSTADELRLMTAWIDAGPGDTILDAGCSAGLYARAVKRGRPSAEVHAVDVSASFLHQARKRARDEQLDLVLLRADVERLPYRDCVFDAVVSGGSLNEFRNPERALRELARVLVPGGRLFLMYTARSTSSSGRFLQKALAVSGLHFPALDTVDAWARGAGLEPGRRELHSPIALALYRKPRATREARASR